MEHVLPDGCFELVINLLETPRRLFDRTDPRRATSFQGGWISGAHSEYIVIDTAPGASMIGAHFRPGGASAFFGTSAGEFKDQVVEMEALWGNGARAFRERLLDSRGPGAKFSCLDQFLSGLLRPALPSRARQQATTWAIDHFCRQPDVMTIGKVAEQLGLSHKHFTCRFREQVGITPKLFCRIRRFQQVLAQINSQQAVHWADVASACGYYDQSHLVNDFQAFAGLNPSAYRPLDRDHDSFVPVPERR
jgi:AraC-like DNA-binding protein